RVAVGFRARPAACLVRVADEERDGAGRGPIAGQVSLDDGVVGDLGTEGGRAAGAGRWRGGGGGLDRLDREAFVGAVGTAELTQRRRVVVVPWPLGAEAVPPRTERAGRRVHVWRVRVRGSPGAAQCPGPDVGAAGVARAGRD